MSINCGENPCRVTQTNTAACESLPSQISNFSDQFFGIVVKTEVDGVVTWSLPCSLDVGLPNNPRAADEGLACYFLRLFMDGIIGFTGPQGASGTAGTNGNNAYTVTLQSFTQPSLASPTIQILTAYNPAIRVGLNVFIDTSGWYSVNATDTSGTLFLTLTEPLPGASGTITAGKLVVPAGVPGQSVQGSQGIQGPVGPQGAPGNTFTSTNGFYFATIGTNYQFQILYATIDFTNSTAQVLLPTAGTYKLEAIIDVVGTGAVALSDLASIKMRDLTIAGDVPGSEQEISALVVNERNQVVVQSIYQVNQATQVALQAKCTSANVVSAVALHTTFSFIRLE